MNSLSNQKLNLLCISALVLIAFGRVLATSSIGCPEYFDCNSYIRMVSDLAPGGDLPGHHGMRIFPILVVRCLMWFGLSIETSFDMVSGLSYCAFGALGYWFIQKVTQNKLVALSWALILLSLHDAIRIPLYLVYQANDALIYPIGLGILMATYYKKTPWVIGLGLLGVFTRQNMFVLSFLSLLFLFKQEKRVTAALGLAVITVIYMLLQSYYGAHGVFQALLSPPDSFFSFSEIGRILIESEFLELWIALIPFILFSLKPALLFFKEHWHWFLYAGIVTFQPLVGYHLTGNNLPRLALQGIWVVALALSLSSSIHKLPRNQQWLLFLYGCAMYSTWGIEERLIIVMVYLISSVWMMKSEKANKQVTLGESEI